MSPNNYESTNDGRSTGVFQRHNNTTTVTFDNNSDRRLRFFYWRSSGGKWKDHIDRDDDYFLESGDSVTLKFRDRGENSQADYGIMFSVKIECGGGIKEFKVEIGRNIHYTMSEGWGFQTNISDSPGHINVDVSSD